jgi:hypothetical protein
MKINRPEAAMVFFASWRLRERQNKATMHENAIKLDASASPWNFKGAALGYR